jgi:hypothetical protein
VKLRIAPNLELPAEAVTQTFAILAKRGVGKTYTASVMVEEMLKAKMHVVVCDPIGVWWGLRAAADGKGPGLPIVIAGGDHADIPITPQNGDLVANLVVDERISMVIDLSLFRKGEQTRFMTDFAETLYHRNRTALHLVLDEADAFAPQRPQKGQERMLGAMEDLVRRGRARGIGVTMITQRPASIHKDVLTQIEVLVALRLVAPQDRNAVDEWIKVHGEPGQREELMQSLPSLPIGTAWFWSPGWLDMFKRVEVRTRETLDTSSTPKAGQQAKEARIMAGVDLDKLREKMAHVIEKAEQDDPKALRRRIAELEREKAHPVVELREKEVRTEVPVFTNREAEFLEHLSGVLEQTGELMRRVINTATPPPTMMVSGGNRPLSPRSKVALEDLGRAAVKHIENEPGSGGTLGKAERSILTVLAQYQNGRNVTQTALLAGYSSKGGGFRNALGGLRSKGLIVGRDNLTITSEGINALGDYEPLPQGQALVDYWLGRLGKAERLIFAAVIDAYPSSLTIEEIAEKTGYAAAGGGFRNALGKLRTLELVEGRSDITVDGTIFAVRS